MSGAYGGASGDFALTITSVETPSNDICSTATPVEPDSGMILGSTLNSTGFGSSFNCSYAETSGVWYSLLGDGGVYAITTCSEELNFDAALSITSGDCDDLECVATDAFNDFNCTIASYSGARSVVRTQVE